MSGHISENKKVIYRNLAVVALPIAVQSLIASSLNLVDNLMVGHLGEAELAAVGAGLQIFFVSWILNVGMSAGCSTFVAQFYGAGEMDNVKKTTGFAAALCFGIGILFFVFGFFAPRIVMRIFTDIPDIIDLGAVYVKYCAPTFLIGPLSVVFQMALKATQQTKYPMYISVISFGTNTFLNWILIFGHFGMPAMGVKGAAIATTIARVVELLLSIYFLLIRKNIASGRPAEFFGWSKELMKRILKNSIPTTLNEGLWSLATTMYVAAYARVGITEYAAYQACETIDRLFIMAAFSLGDAALILVGQRLGEKKLDEAYDLAKLILKIATIMGLILGGLLIACAHPILNLFNFTAGGHHDAFLILLVYGVTMSVNVANGVIITGILRSGGDTRFAMLADTLTIWLIGVPLAWIATALLGWPIYIAVALTKLEEMTKLVIGMKRFVSKKWVNNVVSNI